MGITHLPADLQEAIGQYDARVASGSLVFDETGFAVKPDDEPDLEMEFFAGKIPGIHQQ